LIIFDKALTLFFFVSLWGLIHKIKYPFCDVICIDFQYRRFSARIQEG
jgi:hypothetical protein